MTPERISKLKTTIRSNAEASRRAHFEALLKKLKVSSLDDCTDGFLGLVQGKKDTDLFYDYEDKRKIGLSCLWELLGKTTKNFRFYLSSDQRAEGILPDTQGLSSVGLILEDYGILDADEKIIAPEMLREIIAAYADGIRSLIQDYDEHGVTLTPYESIGLPEGSSYYDSLTWLVSTLLQAVGLSSHSRFDGVFEPELIDKMLQIVHDGIVEMNQGFIGVENEKAFTQGWNFAKGCDHPSLVFSYIVSECYLDIYESVKLCSEMPTIEARLKEGKKLSPENIGVKAEWESLSEVEQAEYRRRFDIINKDDAFYDLDKNVRLCGRDLWRNVKEDIAEEFYNNQVSAPVPPEAIRNSNSSDALFNDLFAINIIVAAGIDVDLGYELLDAADDGVMARVQADLDYLNDSLQAALQRTVRYYNRFVSDKRDYIVNDFIVTCPEEFGSGEMARCAENLRKKRIKLFTLSPLIVKTNNLLADYLVQYPQKEMIKYLDTFILSRRNTDDRIDPRVKQDDDPAYQRSIQYLWIWENNDYLLTSNFYYLSSLADFYRYQEEYEKRFQEINTVNETIRKDIETNHRKELGIAEDGEVRQLKNKAEELKRKEKECAELAQENERLKAKEEAVVTALKEMITKEVRGNFVNWFADAVKTAKSDVVHSLFDADLGSDAGMDEFVHKFKEEHGDSDKLLSAMRDLRNLAYYEMIGGVLLDNCQREGAADRMAEGVRILDQYNRKNVRSIVTNNLFKADNGDKE
ncbi:MAG: hypothetical protein K6E59_05070 [Bacilli bacterium]|nr:hypothetical protein [Bacilli bacterium]